MRSRKLGFCGLRSLTENSPVTKKVISINFHKSLKKEKFAVKSIIKTTQSRVSQPPSQKTTETSVKSTPKNTTQSFTH